MSGTIPDFFGEVIAEKAITTTDWVAIEISETGYYDIRGTVTMNLRSAADGAAGTLTAATTELTGAHIDGGASTVPDVAALTTVTVHKRATDDDFILVRAVGGAGRVKVRRRTQ